MAVILSTGLREGLAVTGPLRTLLNGSVFRIYSGSVPANADAAVGSAVLLCEVGSGGGGVTFEAAAPGGVLMKNALENWTGDNVESGEASFFRLVTQADTGASSQTEVRVQGTVGVIGTDMELTSTTFVSGSPQIIDVAAFTIPATA